MLVLAQIYPWMTAILAALFLFFCVLLILAVLIQRPTGGGLSGAFGSGAGSGQTAFGAKTGDALTYATITIFTIYILFAVGLNYAARPATGGGAPAATSTTGGGAPAETGATGTTGATAPPESPQSAPASTGTAPPPLPSGVFAPAAPAATVPAPATPPAPTGPTAPTGTTPASTPG
jgi:preprotein translocase subunit SecG